jgi:hypothetical protein
MSKRRLETAEEGHILLTLYGNLLFGGCQSIVEGCIIILGGVRTK